MKYHFPKETLEHAAGKEHGDYLRFLDNEALSSGIYLLKAGQDDPQAPHDQDEIYYVIEGHSMFRVGQEEFEARPGDVIYVPAFVPHRFYDIESDLRLLVFFSKVKIKT